MVATPLTATNRYFPVGTRRYYWVPTMANYNSPTRTELNAGTDLTGEVVDGSVSGFSLTSNTVDVPDASTTFTAQITGRTTAASSSVNLYASKTSSDARTLLTMGLSGFIVILQEGDVAGQKMDVWPVYITASSIDPGMDNGGQLMVSFAITKTPALNVTIP